MIEQGARHDDACLPITVSFINRASVIITMNCEQNIELENTYITNGSFMRQMISTSKKFQEFEQQAYYSQLQQSSKSMIITVLADSEMSVKLNNHQQLDYFIFIGAKQPNGNNGIEKTVLNIIHLLPRPKKAYSIIYINTLAAKNSFDDFKKVTQFLPIEYFLNLNKIFVLNASFLSKATSWISFNIITSFVKEKTIHVNDFKELIECTNLNPNQFLKLLPQEIQQELARKEEFVDQLLSYATKMLFMIGTHEPRKLQIKENNQEKRQEKVPQKEIQIINSLVSKSSIVFLSTKKASKRHIEDYQVGQTGAPLPLQMLIYYFKQRDHLLNTEGLFRKSVSIDDENELLAELDDENYDFIQTVTDPHLIANAIKRFVSYLILPVVPFPEYMKMMEARPEKLNEVIVQTIRGLGDLRKKTMLLLLEFLMEKVIPKQSANKMSLKNISIVIGPCLMHSEVSSIKDLIYSQKIIAVMLTIFKEFDTIFGSKKERMLALRKSAKDYNRAYLEDRLKGNQPREDDPDNLRESGQIVLLEPNLLKKEDQKQTTVISSNSKFKLIHKMTHRLKQQLIESKQKEDEYIYGKEYDESSKQLKKKIQQTIVDLSSAKITEQDYLDI